MQKQTKKSSELDVIKKILEIESKTEALYEQKDKLIAKLFATKGHGYTKTFEVGGDKPFMRYALTDNMCAFNEGSMVLYKAAGLKRFNIKIDMLKNKPKEE